MLFSGMDLKNKDFSNKDLKFSDFTNTNLKNVNFKGSNLVGINFENAELLDNDEDGEVDDPELKQELANHGALMPIFTSESSQAANSFFNNYIVLECR